MLTPAGAGLHLARSAQRFALTAGDSLVALALGSPARVRLSVTPSLVVGHAQRARVTIPDVRVAGLHLALVDVRADHVRLPSRWPARLQADRVVVRVHVEQAALDRWTRSSALPLRLALRAGTICARTGIAGRRLGELEIAVHLDGGRLRLAPGRMSMLGVALDAARAPMPPLTLPLPPLPRRVTLVAVEPSDGAIDVVFELTDLDEALTVERLRRAARALRRRAAGAPATPGPRRRGHASAALSPRGAAGA